MLGLIIALSSPCTALASDPGSAQLRDQQRELRHLEQQQRLQRWQHPAQPAAEAPASSPPAPREAPCWNVPGVRLTGNRRLDTPTLEQALQPLVHACMGKAHINALLKAITERYVNAGYTMSRPYLAQVPQAGEPLSIVVVEGFVESIELQDDLPLSLHGAFPGLLGQPLYLPDLEQGLDLNRLRAFDLGLDLLPGEAAGGTQVLVRSQRPATSRWHLESRLDNRGSDLSGRHRLTLGLGLDSPLGLNDQLSLSLLSPVFNAPGHMRAGNLSYGVPYGPWSLSVSASQVTYRTPLPGSRLSGSGTTQLLGTHIERVLWRNAQGMFSSGLRLEHKRTVNRLGTVRVGQQSHTLTTLEASANLLWIGDGLWLGSLGLSQGFGWFGADREPLGRFAPQPRFRKYTASLRHLRNGPAQRPWRWSSELSLQYSPHLLPAIEQMGLTDPQSVRGFRQQLVSGATGAAWRNTFSHALALPLPVEVHPHLGLDLGWGRYSELRSPGHRTPQRLVGAVLGVELSRSDTRLHLDYQRPLHVSGQPRSALERGFWVLDVSMTL